MKHEIEYLRAEDHDELLNFLNTSFRSKEGRTFDIVLPAMWRRTDEAMSKHLAIRIDGKIAACIGIYPMKTTVCGKEIVVATTGNVATAAEYRGLGLMKELMDAMDKEVIRQNIDVCRLGGERKRYNRYGYEKGGADYIFSLTEKNVKTFYNDFPDTDISFVKVSRDSKEALEIIRDIYKAAAAFYVERGDVSRFYDVITAWKHEPYLAISKGGEPIGYLCVTPEGNVINELYAKCDADEFSIAAAWLKHRELPGVTLTSQPWRRALNSAALRYAENWTVHNSESFFRPMNWLKFIDAMLTLKASYSYIPEGGFVLGIEGFGNIEFSGKTCNATERKADITLTSLDAVRFLTGNIDEFRHLLDTRMLCYVNSVLPLPLSWCTLDRI